nr:EOG090X04W0 [Eulimnadia texana]
MNNYVLICLPLLFHSLLLNNAFSLEINIQSSELFIFPLNVKSMNISQSGEKQDDNFEYSASLAKLPDLPAWISYVYNSALKSGFLYGTPSDFESSVKLDLVAFSRQTYEVFHKTLNVEVNQKPETARRLIKLKIHNLNVEDLMDVAVRKRLLEVFQNSMWPESSDDLHFVDLVSALQVGDRKPVNPNEKEGVLVTLGSRAEFSEALRNVQREVSNLWHLRPCPRDFKKTSVERIFRSKGIMLDWCSFRLIPEDPSLVNLPTSQVYSDIPTTERISRLPHLLEDDSIWRAPARWEVPERSYAEDSVVAVFVPLIVMLVIVGFLTAVLGIHPEGQEVVEGQLYEAVFEELPFLKANKSNVPKEAKKPETKNVNEKEVGPFPAAAFKTTGITSGLTGSLQRGSPFLMSSNPGSPSSTLNRSVTTPRSTLRRDGRGSTLGRPEPPPYTGTLRK